MNILFFIFYELTLSLIALIALPKILYSFIVRKKYRHSLVERCGLRFPIKEPLEKPSIWIHAVSVGETKAVVSVARELKKRFPDHPLIISSTTETGHAEAKRSLPFADYHVYMPFDLAVIVQPIIQAASPCLVLLCESDFWYNFLYYSKMNGAVVALVNGKISDRSMRRYRMISFFSDRLFALFDLFCLQNNLYRGRYIEAGVDPKKIIVTGNLKLDEEYPRLSHDEVIAWRQKLGILPNQIVLTIGSTHAPEEALFLDIIEPLWKKYPELRVILVPRHPDRFKEVGHLLDKEGVSWVNFSDIQRCTGKERVILIDAMGLLRMCYQLADLTIVGGSYTDKVGGHNILEPCWYGKPVLFGPCMHSQVELVGLMKEYGAGKQVKQEELSRQLEAWIEHLEERNEVGAKGLKLINDLRGSTKKTFKGLDPLLSRL